MTPTLDGVSISFPTRFPSTRISPASSFKKPQMHLKSTVFPLPFLPIIPWIFPASKLRETSSSALYSLNFFVTCLTSILIPFSILLPPISGAGTIPLPFYAKSIVRCLKLLDDAQIFSPDPHIRNHDKSPDQTEQTQVNVKRRRIVSIAIPAA